MSIQRSFSLATSAYGKFVLILISSWITVACVYCCNLDKLYTVSNSLKNLLNNAFFTKKQSFADVLWNRCLQRYQKETLAQVFSCEIFKILKIPFFTEHFGGYFCGYLFRVSTCFIVVFSLVKSSLVVIMKYAQLNGEKKTQQTFLVFQYVFSVTIFHLSRRLRNVFKTSLQDVFQLRLQDNFKKSLQDVFKTPSRRAYKMSSSRRLQDIFKTSSSRLANTS